MSDAYLDQLEQNAIDAVMTLEKERYTEFSWGIMELVRQCKHYQQITESVLSAHAGMASEKNEAEVKRSREHRDWYRYGDNE